MLSVFTTAWVVIIKRSRADWLIIAAAMLIILLSTTLLASGPIYADAVTIAGLHRTLDDAETVASNVNIASRLRADAYAKANDDVARIASDTFAATGADVERMGYSDSFALPDQPGETVTNLTNFAFFDNLAQHAALVEGAWPTPSDASTVQVVVSDSTAELLDLHLNSELEVVNRRSAEFVVMARVVGIYTINDPDDPYWFQKDLDVNGIREGSSFVTYGPLVVSVEDFFRRVMYISSEVNWRIYPHVPNLSVAEVPGYRRALERLNRALNDSAATGQQYNVTTELPSILRRAERSLLVTRAGILILTVQMAILAGYALVLTAGLLIEQRKVETALLRSRGGSSSQIAAMALMEGLLLALPAAIAGPWLAALSLRLLNVFGPLRAIDLRLQPTVTSLGYGLSAVAALACVVALVFPAYFAANSFIATRQERGREGLRGFAQRGGLDIALLALAGLGYWQLRRYGAPITDTVQGRLGLDPFLVAAPAIGLLAGAIVALRVIPLLASLAERLMPGTKPLLPAVGIWQIARRPLRYTRAALLLMLALAIGLFAVSYTRTWTQSQDDQAQFQVGSDIRIRPDIRTGRSIADMNLAAAYATLPGFEAAMPVRRQTLTVSRSVSTGQLLAVDAAAGEVLRANRDDLAPAPWPQLLDGLVDRRMQSPAFELEGTPTQLRIGMALTIDSGDVSLVGSPYVAVVLRDGRGLLHRMTSPAFGWNGAYVAEFDLTRGLGDSTATPEYPLSLVGVELRTTVPNQVPATGRVELREIAISDAALGPTWNNRTPALAAAGLEVSVPVINGLQDSPSAEMVPDTDMPSFTFNSGARVSDNMIVPLTITMHPEGAPAAEQGALAALASDVLLNGTEAKVGDVLQLEVAGTRRPVEIVGSFSAFPATAGDGAVALVVDLPTFAALYYEFNGRIDRSDEWWLKVDETEIDAAVAQVRATPFSSWRVEDRVDRSRVLRTDPVALGIIGALSLGFVSAALFGIIGFIVSASVSAHERLSEFSLLRALGMAPKQLSGWLALENGVLVAISLVAGAALGIAMSWLILPFVTLTQSAARVFPGIDVIFPWMSVLALLVVTLLVLVLVVGVLVLLLRRVGLGTILRMGEE